MNTRRWNESLRPQQAIADQIRHHWRLQSIIIIVIIVNPFNLLIS